jgi:hypothetical protein
MRKLTIPHTFYKIGGHLLLPLGVFGRVLHAGGDWTDASTHDGRPRQQQQRLTSDAVVSGESAHDLRAALPAADADIFLRPTDVLVRVLVFGCGCGLVLCVSVCVVGVGFLFFLRSNTHTQTNYP